jgi:ADP-ribosylglycohydrolase
MKQSAKAMVFGSFVADSLALGVHWIYDTGKIDGSFGRITELLAPGEGSYHPGKARGGFTHYGDQALHLLNHLQRQGGVFELDAYGQDWQQFMTDYQGYRDRASKATLENLESGKSPRECGSPSTDLGGAARIAPLVYAYRKNPTALAEVVKAQTALTHNSPAALAGARFLADSCLAVLAGASPREAFEQVLASGVADPQLAARIVSALRLEKGSVRQKVGEFGQACGIGSALPGAVYAIVSSPDSLEEALIETVMAGGESAARGMVVGMVLGAQLGMESIPERWLRGLGAGAEIAAALDALP